MIIVSIENSKYISEITYTFDIIFSFWEIGYKICKYDDICKLEIAENQDLLICYGNSRVKGIHLQRHIHIYESDLWKDDYLKIASMPKSPLKKCYDKELLEITGEEDLPVIYQGFGNLKQWIVKDRNAIETNIDFIASIFFMLTRYEEVVVKTRDEIERFPAKESIAYKNNFLHRPIVNEYIELLYNLTKQVYPDIRKKDYKFEALISHDIDTPLRFPNLYTLFISFVSELIRKKNILRALRCLLYLKNVILKNHDNDPNNTYEFFMMNERGLQTAYYFMGGGNTDYDEKYDLRSKFLFDLIKKLKQNNCEVGFHPSYATYRNPRLWKAEKESLENAYHVKVKGGRQHFLRVNVSETFKIWEENAMQYDSSLGYSEQIGFRCGCCFAYELFDLLTRRKLKLREIPLLVMDTSLKRGIKIIKPDEALLMVKEIIDRVKKYNGIFTLLWHNANLSLDSREQGWHEWKPVYLNIINTIKELKEIN